MKAKKPKFIVITKKKMIYSAVMAVFLIAAFTFIKPAATTVFNATVAKTERKLPIYCVDTDKKQISISFDAAWGACK